MCRVGDERGIPIDIGWDAAEQIGGSYEGLGRFGGSACALKTSVSRGLYHCVHMHVFCEWLPVLVLHNEACTVVFDRPGSADKAKTLSALEYAADQGHLAAQWKVCRTYAAGDGVPKDDQRAFIYFSQIANTILTSLRVLHRRRSWPMPSAPGPLLFRRVSPTPPWRRMRFALWYVRLCRILFRRRRRAVSARTPLSRRFAERPAPGGALVPACRDEGAIVGAEAVLVSMLFEGEHVPRQAARGLMWLTLGRPRRLRR